MTYLVTTSANYHWIKSITASRNTADAVLKLTLNGDPAASDYSYNQAEITVFMEDAAMVDRLIEAINGVNRQPEV